MEYTKKIREIYNAVPSQDKETIANFFIIFSFFEFGIKELGLTEKNKKHPSPSWKTYIDKIIDKFDPNESRELEAAIEYMKETPPGKQVFKDSSSMTYDDSYFKNKNDINLQVLIEMIKTVRNNFFHGGKVKDFMKNDYERNINLFKNSLVILNACLMIDEKIDNGLSEFL